MRNASVWQRVLGLARTMIEAVVSDEDAEAVVVSVRPRKGAQRRCGRCGRRAGWFDRGEGRRRWRGLDLGAVPALLEAEAPRVNCPTHGPTVVQVPWARHGVGHARDFDETVAWLATQCSKTAVVELMRIAWRTVGAIVARVSVDIDARVDRLAGLRRIGIDEISYKRGHRYLTVAVDHDSGALVWAAPGRDEATLRRFFDALGVERAGQITHVSADAADWIATVVAERCPHALRCADAFHVAWATDALDEVRRQAWNEARGAVERRRAGWASGHARALKRARYALWKNPEEPHPPPASETGLDRQDRSPAVAGLPPQSSSGASRRQSVPSEVQRSAWPNAVLRTARYQQARPVATVERRAIHPAFDDCLVRDYRCRFSGDRWTVGCSEDRARSAVGPACLDSVEVGVSFGPDVCDAAVGTLHRVAGEH